MLSKNLTLIIMKKGIVKVCFMFQVNGESLVGMTHAKAVQMIRKSKDKVVLTISRYIWVCYCIIDYSMFVRKLQEIICLDSFPLLSQRTRTGYYYTNMDFG